MKSISLSALILVSLAVKLGACGYDPYESYTYHLFDQHYIASKGYSPFIKEDLYVSWAYQNSEPVITQNVTLWKDLLTNWSTKNITKALTTDTAEVFEALWPSVKSVLENKSYQYMVYARECSKSHEVRKRYSWSYDDVVEDNSEDLSELIAQGTEYFTNESNPQLKLRYAYQVIRNYHYSKRYQEAVLFFNNMVKDLFEKNELYYYVLDQVAGCYYSLEDYEKAAYLFLTVFNQSYDRKVSAYTSYKFCTDKDAEGKSYFATSDDQAAYLTLKSIRSYTDQITCLKELAEVSPQDEKLELLFVRELYDLETEVFPRRVGITSQKLLCSDAMSDCWDQIKILSDLSAKLETTSKQERKDFWVLCSSYLYFLKGDFDHANKKLDVIQLSNAYSVLANQLKVVYQVFAWNKIEVKQESDLVGILNKKELSGDNKELILEYVGHLLYHEGKLAQSFLIHNKVSGIENMGSIKLLEQVKNFINKSSKTAFEKMLIAKSVQGQTASMEPSDFLDYQLGLYYLNHADPAKALAYLDHITKLNTQTSIGHLVPGKVFSNNMMECFDCEDDLMEDEVYKASVFSFIKPELSKKELAVSLIKLDSLTRDTKQWKQKLAYYMLGNYYFNVSNTGYYRGVLKDRSNCCHSWYFGWNSRHIQERNKKIEELDGYNLCDVSFQKQTYYALADQAYQYYRKTIELSTDKELNARCLYMMAKCELNQLYNSKARYSYMDYDGGLKGEAANYKKSFQELKEDYQNTQFFNRIIKECSFFKYYCSE